MFFCLETAKTKVESHKSDGRAKQKSLLETSCGCTFVGRFNVQLKLFFGSSFAQRKGLTVCPLASCSIFVLYNWHVTRAESNGIFL